LDVAERCAEHEARDRMHLHDLFGSGAAASAPHEALSDHRRFLVDEGERHELGEAPRVLLDVAQEQHVLCPVLVGFDVPVHDGGRRADAELVRRGHDLDPLCGRDAPLRDDVAHGVVEDFGRRAGKRVVSSVLQRFEVVADGHVGARRAVENFFRRKGMQV
jgi:hypothetical protein